MLQRLRQVLLLRPLLFLLPGGLLLPVACVVSGTVGIALRQQRCEAIQTKIAAAFGPTADAEAIESLGRTIDGEGFYATYTLGSLKLPIARDETLLRPLREAVVDALHAHDPATRQEACRVVVCMAEARLIDIDELERLAEHTGRFQPRPFGRKFVSNGSVFNVQMMTDAAERLRTEAAKGDAAQP